MENNETPEVNFDKDWFLQIIIELVNDSKLSVGLTILTHGFLVSGNLIGGREYFEKIGKEMGSFSNDPTGVKETFKKMGDKIYSDKKNDKNPLYVHLDDARFFQTSGEPIPSNEGVCWRGRMSEISGFSLGLLRLE